MSTPKRSVIHAPHLVAAERIKIDSPVQVTCVMAPRVSIVTKARRLATALNAWRKAGLPLTPKPERRARQAACDACPLFDSFGNYGLGECRAPGCSCTQLKTWLSNEKCPHPDGSRWPDPT